MPSNSGATPTVGEDLSVIDPQLLNTSVDGSASVASSEATPATVLPPVASANAATNDAQTDGSIANPSVPATPPAAVMGTQAAIPQLDVAALAAQVQTLQG